MVAVLSLFPGPLLLSLKSLVLFSCAKFPAVWEGLQVRPQRSLLCLSVAEEDENMHSLLRPLLRCFCMVLDACLTRSLVQEEEYVFPKVDLVRLAFDEGISISKISLTKFLLFALILGGNRHLSDAALSCIPRTTGLQGCNRLGYHQTWGLSSSHRSLRGVHPTLGCDPRTSAP